MQWMIHSSWKILIPYQVKKISLGSLMRKTIPQMGYSLASLATSRNLQVSLEECCGIRRIRSTSRRIDRTLMRTLQRHRIETGVLNNDHQTRVHIVLEIAMAMDIMATVLGIHEHIEVTITRLVLIKSGILRTRFLTQQSRMRSITEIQILWAKNSPLRRTTRPNSKPSSISRRLSKAISEMPSRGRHHHTWRVHQHQVMCWRQCLLISMDKEQGQVHLVKNVCNSHKLWIAQIIKINRTSKILWENNISCRTNQIPGREVSKAKTWSQQSKWSRHFKLEAMDKMESTNIPLSLPSLKSLITWLSQNPIKSQKIHKKGLSFQSKRCQTSRKL